ncbi:SH3 domain-containing protein [Candidatus Leptofilum sp.]|uniref:SH3 domain-containing protein n=1 Tax=Candidatus Leptofilum sp. TaxID=3241576 RepID=UPI003B59BAD6
MRAAIFNYVKEHSIVASIIGALALIVTALIAYNATLESIRISATATKQAEISGTSLAINVHETVNAIPPEVVEIDVTRLVPTIEEVEVTREVEIIREVEVTRLVETELEVTRLITVEVTVQGDPPPTVDPPEPQNPIVKVNATANIRSGPGINYPVVATASDGDEFEIIGKICDSSWWQISLTDDQLGWIHNSVVDASNLSEDIPCITPDPPPITIQITNPSNGSTVDMNTNVTFNVVGEIPVGYRPIILVHPLLIPPESVTYPYYPHWQPDSVGLGGWIEPTEIGGPSDSGRQFEIYVLIVSENNISNATELTNLLPSLVRSVVTVTRR